MELCWTVDEEECFPVIRFLRGFQCQCQSCRGNSYLVLVWVVLGVVNGSRILKKNKWLFYLCMVLRIESRARHILGEYLAMKIQPQPHDSLCSPGKKQSICLCFIQPKRNLANKVSFQAWCCGLPMTELPFSENVCCGKGDRR